MASKSNSRHWILLGAVVLGVVAAATLPRRAPEEAEEPVPEPTHQLDGGKASRRIAEGCEPVEESLKYEEFVGGRALAILSWNGMSERAANLKVPVHVVGIEDGSVGVRIMQIPMREQYIGIWLGSGHIEAGGDNVFLLDPCSATIVKWPEMDPAAATDDE
jgi:hypothetical protein